MSIWLARRQARSKAIYGRTRRAVADALRDATERQRSKARLSEDERQTIPEFLTRWLQDVARTRVRPRTFAGYEAAIERHISPHLGRVRLAKLTPQHLQAWMATLETNGVSAGAADMRASCCGRRSIRRFAGVLSRERRDPDRRAAVTTPRDPAPHTGRGKALPAGA